MNRISIALEDLQLDARSQSLVQESTPGILTLSFSIVKSTVTLQVPRDEATLAAALLMSDIFKISDFIRNRNL